MSSSFTLLAVCSLLIGVLFDPRDGGNMLLRKYIEYTASHTRREYFSFITVITVAYKL
jgi:hypothetical protein